MLQTITYSMLVATALAVTGCSSVKTQIDAAPTLRELPLDAREARLQGLVDQALADLHVSH